jgi:hypothetical protein
VSRTFGCKRRVTILFYAKLRGRTY